MKTDNDAATIQTILDRFNHFYLPRVLSLKEKVDAGGCLDDSDTHFLTDVLNNSHNAIAIVDRHPEFQNLAARAISLYHHVTEKGLENENKR